MARINMRNVQPEGKQRTVGTPSFYRDQSGVAAIIVAIGIALFLGFAALAIDVWHAMMVKNELQNAADATALAAARDFASQTNPAPYTTPDWSTPVSTANSYITKNNSDGTPLAGLDDNFPKVGYWNLAHDNMNVDANGKFVLKDKTIIPGSQDFPAIQVQLSRSPGHNGGPVQNWIASVSSIIGITTFNLSATATAVAISPGTIHGLVPFAIDPTVANQAKTYPYQTEIDIGSVYHSPLGLGGQWTSFQTDANDVPTISGFLNHPETVPSLSIGDSIWIEPGTKTSIYNHFPSNLIGTDVVLPIVQAITTHARSNIVGFIGFHITSVVGGSGKYISGYFTSISARGGSGIGPNYGVYSPPKLVQ